MPRASWSTKVESAYKINLSDNEPYHYTFADPDTKTVTVDSVAYLEQDSHPFGGYEVVPADDFSQKKFPYCRVKDGRIVSVDGLVLMRCPKEEYERTQKEKWESDNRKLTGLSKDSTEKPESLNDPSVIARIKSESIVETKKDFVKPEPVVEDEVGDEVEDEMEDEDEETIDEMYAKIKRK